MENNNQQIQDTVNMMAECLRDNTNAHLLATRVGAGATFTMGGTLLDQLTLLTSLEVKVEKRRGCSEMAAKTYQDVKPRVVRRPVHKLDRVGVNLWLTSNAVTDGYRLLLRKRSAVLGNKKAHSPKAMREPTKIISN